MIAGVYNIRCEQGASFTRTFTLKDSDDIIIDLTGYKGRMHIRRDVDATTSLMSLTTENGRMSISSVLGEITISLTPTETASIPRNGVYDLEIYKEATGEVHRVVKGMFLLDKEVTR